MPTSFKPERKPVILVVDDVEANRSVVCRRLEGDNYTISAVDSGEKALRFIEDERPDLILLDYMMPGMNGIDVLNVIRNDWHMDDLPIIMLTARAEAEAVVAALEAGADDYVSKPIDFDVLKARIETQLLKVKSKDGLLKANAALDERVAMRVLAFDKLREELEREIGQRKRAERDLALLREAKSAEPVSTGGPGVSPKALAIVDALIGAASAGKPINLALLTALRVQLSSEQTTA